MPRDPETGLAQSVRRERSGGCRDMPRDPETGMTQSFVVGSGVVDAGTCPGLRETDEEEEGGGSKAMPRDLETGLPL